jgi:hypothetical protein
MTSNLKFAVVACVAAGSLLTGCASVQKGDPARSAEIRKFGPKTDVAQIYVCRKPAFGGMAIRPIIEVDSKPIGTVATSTYAYAELQPGPHVIVAKSPEHESKIDFTVAVGEKKFFETWIVPGVFIGRALIEETQAEKGKECVSGADLVEPEKG